MSLKSILESHQFAVTAEIGPAKGTDIMEIVEVAELLHGRITAANATDQQSSQMRMGSMATCHILADYGIEPIMQMTCRDRNRIALQSDLLSAWALGIKNVLALTGDLPALGDHPQAMPVFDLDSVQLLSVIRRLNEGFDMAGTALKGKPDFFAGAAVNPGSNTEASQDQQLFKMEKKIKAGAKFFQTQAVYEPAKFAAFMKKAGSFGVPVLVGIIPLKSAGMARFLNKSIAGVFVPEDMIQKMSTAKDKTQTSLEITVGLIKELKDMCQGVHIMAMGWEKKIPQILDAVGLK